MSEKKIEEISLSEKSAEAVHETGRDALEKKGLFRDEDSQKLRKEIEKIELDDHLKIQAQSQAHNLDASAMEKEMKVKKLLEIAKAKGVIFAVSVAKKINDPYVLDSLHDRLIEGGYYKNLSNSR